MTRYAAFLRGVNLGKRTVKSADLLAAFDAMGIEGAKTLLASGNVLFDAEDEEAALAARIEAGLAKTFGFEIGTVLRSRAELEAMVALRPFGETTETDDLKLYVTMLAGPEARRLTLPCGIPGDFEVIKITDRDIYHEAYRMPTGRFGPGATLIGKPFGRKLLWTNRNWNTILKAAAL